jgi:hypothetical protein
LSAQADRHDTRLCLISTLFPSRLVQRFLICFAALAVIDFSFCFWTKVKWLFSFTPHAVIFAPQARYFWLHG